jgi:transposase
VDLTSIDGIDVITAQTILSEIGTDMSGFKTEDHFASWLGLTPNKDITGGKIIGSGKRKVQNRVAMALRMAATTLLRSQTYLGGPLSTPAKATALACIGHQGDGSLPGGAGVPHAHPRRSLGGSRRGERTPSP